LQYRFRQWLRGKQICARGKRRTEFVLTTDLGAADGALFPESVAPKDQP